MITAKPSSLRWNIAISAISNGYVAVISLVMAPIYISWMGAEAYGLVGFNAMLQGWFALLDLGLSLSFGREVARYWGGAVSGTRLRQLLRTLEVVFFSIAFVGCVAIILGSEQIASHWIRSDNIGHTEIVRSVTLMTLSVGTRWVVGLYRSMLSGSEQLVWLGWASIALATIRSFGAIGVFALVSNTPTAFFSWQLAASIFELILIGGLAYRLLPIGQAETPWSWQPLRQVLRLSATFAGLIGVWVVVNNLDKLLLSALLSLSEYAAFTVAVLAASGISLIISPVATAVLPRLARLDAAGDESALIKLYRHVTQFQAATAFSAAMVLSFFPREVLWAWTGNIELVEQSAKILRLYAVGNGIMAIVMPPYYLQYAKGDLRLHLLGNLGLAILLIPAIIFATREFGAVGAGYAWMACNALYLVIWIPVIHHRFIPGIHLRWLGADVLPIAVATAGTACVLRLALSGESSRLFIGFIIAVISALTLSAGVIASPLLRRQIKNWIQARWNSGII